MCDMFCFQCEQTSGGKACTKVGVCGKNTLVANAQDELTCALVGLANSTKNGSCPDKTADELMMQGLFTTITNVSFDFNRVKDMTRRIEEEKERLGGADDLAPESLWTGDVDIVSLRSTLLLGLRGMAAYAWHAYALGKEDPEVTAWFYIGMRAIGEDHTVDEWLNRAVTALL